VSRRVTGWFGAVCSLLVIAGAAPLDPLPAGGTATAPARWPSRVITLPGGAVASVAAEATSVYALTRPLDGGPPSSNPPGTISRIELSDLGTRSSRPIGGAGSLAVVGRSLWVSTTTFPAAPGRGTEGSVRIERFGASTLRPIGETLLADDVPSTGEFSSLTSVPGGPCWASVGPHLYRLDPTSGRVLSTTTLFFDIESLSENPAGSILYASGEGLLSADYQPSLVVQQLDAVSGTVLASSSGEAVGGGSVSAAPLGVWVSARSGNAGASYQLRRGTLALVPVPPSPLPADGALAQATGLGDGPYESIGGVQGIVSHHVLWLSAFAYLACADPSTEAVRGYELTDQRTAGNGSLVAVGRRLVLGGVHGISVIQPPGACFS
jgi:hypothetical protein